MADRIHERDVKAALTKVMLLYPRGTRFQYEPVEPSAGAPARLWMFEEGHGRISFPGLDHGMLGWTRKEALRTLIGIKAGMGAQRVLQGEMLRRVRPWLVATSTGADPAGRDELRDLVARLDELTAGF
jgi:hypothetical protein